MDATRRRKLEHLERELSRLDAAEQRALAVLDRVGYSFRSVAQARKWLEAERTMQCLTVDQVIQQYIDGGARARKRRVA
jgi:hypothetical protein